MSNTAAEAYADAVTAINGAYQRFQYGFGGQIEVLLTLLQKQHYQAAADIMPLIQREKVGFEAVLLEIQSSLEDKARAANQETLKSIVTEIANGPGTLSGEAAAAGETPAEDSGSAA